MREAKILNNKIYLYVTEFFAGMYYDYAMAAAQMAGVHTKGKPLDVLILGMGSGTYATQCNRYYDKMNIKGVEIDEKITDLSRKYFHLPKDIEVVTYDGRAYMQAIATDKNSEKYDIIMVDAYQDITIPFQMSTTEFFTLVKNQLKDDGVMVVNMNMRASEEGSINQYLEDTIASVFPNVYTVDCGKYSTNRELFASENAGMMAAFDDNLSKEKNKELYKFMKSIKPDITKYKKGDHVMTDDKAPVELLGIKAIDEIIEDEVDQYRDIYEREGLQGVINSVL